MKTNLFSFLLAFLCVFPFASLLSQTTVPPPNAGATVDIKGTVITIRYNDHLVFSGDMSYAVESIQSRTNVYREGERIQQVVLLTTLDWNKKIMISAKVYGSEESFPCEADRPSGGPLVVRHSSGMSRSLRNRAVYDRSEDWVLSVDGNPSVVVLPVESAGKQKVFAMEIEGYEIVLRFRPRFYQKHRGLEFFEPWTYKVWPHSVVGWISWFAFYSKVTEKDILETADVFSAALRPFGFEYLQIDDGYQQGRGAPELWLNPNEKFPHGLKFLTDYIKSKGLKPGIWTAVGIDQRNYVEERLTWFVRDAGNKPVRGNWIEYALDASNPEALNNIVRPLYRGLHGQGWEYFKVDGLRHLRYEGYNANREYFEKKKVDRVTAYREYAKAVRGEIGRDHFMLGCWGIRPELVGIIDGCRIGDDGFSYAGLAQYNSFNNIVWRNDPDHIELNEDAYRSTMVTSLTGSLFMLTDKPAVYRTPGVESARRTGPVLFTLPGQVYDVDPSRSDQLHRVDTEVSGSGPRVFDAGYTPQCHLYLLEINRPFEYWCVLGRTGGDFTDLRFSDLGLDPKRDYYVFEFWNGRLLGSFTSGFSPGRIDPKFKAQAFCIRERKAHPQLIATSRHVTAGGVDLVDVRWDGTNLTGISKTVAGDPYVLYLTEPSDYRLEKFDCGDLPVDETERDGYLLKITFRPQDSAEVQWNASFSRGN